MSRTKWKEQSTQVAAENKDLKKQIEELNAKIQEKIQELDALSVSYATEKSSLQDKLTAKEGELLEQLSSAKATWEIEKSQLENQLSEAKKESKNKQEQINSMELKRMASAYSTQEQEYASDLKEWREYLLLSALVLVLATFWSVILASGKPWYDRFEFYLIDFILISAVWFTAWQYSYFSKLRNDFANRKTLAQTYHNILLSLGESSDPNENAINIETKRLFIDKATQVLCAQVAIETTEPILSRELFKGISKAAEIIIKTK